MATKTEVRNRVAVKLGIIESGGTPSADEITDIEAAYDELYAWLSTKDAVTWDDDEDIPNEAVYHFINLLAANLGDQFTTEGEYQRMKVDAYGIPGATLGSFGELIDLAKQDYVSSPVEATYY